MSKIEKFILPEEKIKIKKKIGKGCDLDTFYQHINIAFTKNIHECLGYDLMKLARCLTENSPAYVYFKTFASGNNLNNTIYDKYFTYLKKHVDWGKYTLSDIRYNIRLLYAATEKNIPLLYTIKEARDGIYYCVLISKDYEYSYFMIETMSINFKDIDNTRGYVTLQPGQVMGMKYPIICYFVLTPSRYF
jgi:hypothetical protein